MKNIFLMISLLISIISYGQVAIGKTSITNASCLLEFGPANRGIRLPLLTNTSTAVVSPGAIAFDIATGSFRFYTGSWSSATSGGITVGSITGSDTGGGVIIGSSTTSAIGGSLTLESGTRALVLPTINNPESRILTPDIGLVAWDSAKGQVAVYNGNKWCYY